MTKEKLFSVFKQHRQILPLLLLTGYCIDAVVTSIRGTVVMAGEAYDYELTTKHYIAFGVVAINFLIYFFLRQFYKYTLGLTVLVGLFNLIIFSALETTLGFSLNSLKVGFQPTAFLAGLLAYILNFKRVNSFIIDSIATERTPEEIEKNQQAIFDEETQKYKDLFAEFSNESLTEILTADKYVPAALAAARQILNERETNETSN
jgi:hypothetical protein